MGLVRVCWDPDWSGRIRACWLLESLKPEVILSCGHVSVQVAKRLAWFNTTKKRKLLPCPSTCTTIFFSSTGNYWEMFCAGLDTYYEQLSISIAPSAENVKEWHRLGRFFLSLFRRDSFFLFSKTPILALKPIHHPIQHVPGGVLSLGYRGRGVNLPTSFLIKPTDVQFFPNLFLSRNSTYFGQFLCPSSGVLHCTFGTGICHAGLMTWHDLHGIYQCRMYNVELPMMGRGTTRNM